MFFIPRYANMSRLGSKQKCAMCGGPVGFRFKSMAEWDIQGIICDKCYSKKINEHYPGSHVRVNQNRD